MNSKAILCRAVVHPYKGEGTRTLVPSLIKSVCWLTSADHIEINGPDTIFIYKDKSHTSLIAEAPNVFIYDGTGTLSVLEHVKAQLPQY